MKVFDGHREIRLGPKLGAGADGSVYRVDGNEGACIKIFDQSARSRLRLSLPRIASLVRLAPSLDGNAAIPTYLVAETPNGLPIGFGMKRIVGQEAHNLYGVSSRQIHFPGTDFRFLVQAAKNAAIATERLHRYRVVIGDISGRNLMVRQDATVCWIDSDSFLIGDPTFRDVCRLVTPEWTPPELQGDRHLQNPRLPGHDAFGLAVMIFHVLMLGRHPFQGRFTGKGEAPDIPKNIRNRWYAHAGYPAIPLKSPVGTPPVSHLGREIEHLFIRAFLEEGANRRPTAAEWVEALRKLEGTMRRCPSSTAHFFSSAATRCPWCQVLPDYGNLDPFQGVVVMPGFGAGVAMGPLASEIAGFVASLAPPSSIPNQVYRPVASAAAATWIHEKPSWFASWFSSGESERRKVQTAKAEFDRIVSNVEAEMIQNLRLQQDWLNRMAGVARRFSELQAEAGTKLAPTVFKSAAKRALENVLIENERSRYLARFNIVAGQIAGIGDKRVAELAGHGITTAADIVSHRILSIPGFGEAFTSALLVWRHLKAKGFRPNAVTIPLDQIEQRARQLLEEKKGEFVRRREPLVRELVRMIQDAKTCAGQAITIQLKLDSAKANVLAAEQVLKSLA